LGTWERITAGENGLYQGTTLVVPKKPVYEGVLTPEELPLGPRFHFLKKL
jgi:hypothetical protein